MLKKSTIQLLRFHFSLFLLPVFLFALSQANHVDWRRALLVFFIWHLLVYPSSNGYNSFMDRDETPVGGLRSPLQPTKQLFHVTLVMDALALLLGAWISLWFSLGIFIYIIASRAYSYRGIRIKKYPIAGFLTVFIFQGAHVYLFSIYALSNSPVVLQTQILPALISSLLIGALYPLTQIYQHEEDKNDGVITISYLLGKKGSFIFSMLFFLAATILMYWLFKDRAQLNFFYFFLLFMFPVVSFFLYWMSRVWKDGRKADFKHSMIMNMVSTLCTTTYFLFLNFYRH